MDQGRRRAAQAIARTAQTPAQTPQSLFAGVCEALDGCLDLLGICWHVTDPQTGIPVISGGVGHPPGDFERSLEFEFAREDVLRFADLAQARRPVGVLSHATGGRPSDSPRWREMIEPEGGADELRAAFADRFGVWGSLSLFGTRRFSPEDADLVAGLVPAITHGLRVAVAGLPRPDTTLDTAPAVVLLDRDDRILAADARARALIAAIAPGSVLVLAAQARADDAPAGGMAQHRDGHWLTIDASRLDDGSVALVLQPASAESRLDSLLRAFGLSDRERQVAQLAVLGRSNKAVATELFISPWTVQDHLKNIFEKASVSSRGELAALIARG